MIQHLLKSLERDKYKHRDFPTASLEIHFNYSFAELGRVSVYLIQNLTYRISKRAAEVAFEFVMNFVIQDLHI
jgi:hypothetical protein